MTKSGERTAAALLEHAIAAIESGGEGAVRVAAIAEASGVSVISLYHFYGNREGLIEAALAEMYLRSMVEVNDALAEAIVTVMTPEEVHAAVRLWSEAILTAERAPYRRTRVRVIGSTAGRPALEELVSTAQTESLTKFAWALGVLQERGVLRDDVAPMDLATWVSSMVLARVALEVAGDACNAENWNLLTIEAISQTVLPRP